MSKIVFKDIIVPKTEDNRNVFPGFRLFLLKDSHGLPLESAIDKVMNEAGLPIDWTSFIVAARSSGWWDYQIIEAVENGLKDADVQKDLIDPILLRIKCYMQRNPHPNRYEGK